MRLISILVLALALAACSGDPESGADPTGAPATTADAPDTTVALPGEPVCISESHSPAPEFVGLSEEEAVDLAGERGLQVREVGRDGECFPVTEDLREDRINLEFIGDVVVGAAIY